MCINHSLVCETLPAHKSYSDPKYKGQMTEFKKTLADAIKELERLKPIINSAVPELPAAPNRSTAPAYFAETPLPQSIPQSSAWDEPPMPTTSYTSLQIGPIDLLSATDEDLERLALSRKTSATSSDNGADLHDLI